MSLIGSRKSGISARLVEASARAVVVMAHQDTGGLLRRPCAWLAPALGSAVATHKAGHPSGTSGDVAETMHFAVLSGVRAWIEERPLTEAAEAYAAMDEGRARYRMVLTM